MLQTIKFYKLLIIALVVCSNLFSQTNVYKPFPEGNANWNMTKQSMFGLSYYNYKTSGDTLIGAYTYKKVSYAYNLTPGPFNFSPYTFSFAYRNDSINKKVYYLDVTGGINKDTLWYDFNLNVGDTVKNSFSYLKTNIEVMNRVVSSIDSIQICGTYHKRFNFNCTDYASGLIEGAGYMDHFIHTQRHNDCLFEPVEIYSSGLSTCYFTSVKDYVKENQIKLYPNPASSELKISPLINFSNYSILNNLGEIVLYGTDSSNISVAILTSGLYIINIHDKSGNYYQSKFIKQ